MFAAEPVNPVAPDVPNMFWGAVFFLILFLLMYSICLPPVRKAMRQRTEQQRLDAEAADKADIEAEQVRRDFEATLASARAEASRIIDEARAEAEGERQRRVAALEAELGEARLGRIAEIATAREQALTSVSADVTSVAAAAASKVVGRSIDAAAQRSIIDDAVASASRR